MFMAFLVFAYSCQKTSTVELNCERETGKLFTLMHASHTGIDFVNELSYTEEFNTYTYRNFYNGGGVAIADVNSDGLSDLFFCGNMVSNRLYLNKGNFVFEDVTDASGLNSKGVWTTGVSIADVNGDGLLDIFVCKSGIPKGNKRNNELFINKGNKNGIPEFEDMAAEYGIADKGFSNHAAFFDYDKDGDLDMYLLNNSIQSVGNFEMIKDQRLKRDPHGGNKLYRNDTRNSSLLEEGKGGVFTDVSEEAGIFGSAIGFGLGVSIGDVNKDGWLDIFISNDFFERDYLYLNNQDGTFTESLENVMGEISLGSMGADMADINNDGFPEIFVTEMLPESETRFKTKAVFQSWDTYSDYLEKGYFRQFPRNVLHLNSGYVDSENNVSMTEISRYSGVDATDWSWGALIADLDNDGWKDLFVANGIYKDLIDLDYVNFYADPTTTKRLFEERGSFLKELVDKIPSNPLPNYAFRNLGDLTFLNKASEWGLGCPGFSSGSVYGDLDNDGDLDLVTNNVNMPPFIYRNNADSLLADHHFLTVSLKGTSKNTFALGSQVTVFSDGKSYYQELAPMRGFQSNVENKLHFGLGTSNEIDSILIRWPDLSYSIVRDVNMDQQIEISQSNIPSYSIVEVGNQKTVIPYKNLFKDVSEDFAIETVFEKSDFVDFSRDPLLFHMNSAEGAAIVSGDVNGDNREDIFFGGSKGKSAVLYLQKPDGEFEEYIPDCFEKDKSSVDTDAAFFDADRDGDLDLYVCSGGNEFPASSSSLSDRLYINDGRGGFIKSDQMLPVKSYENTSTVTSGDFDKDGDQDLFVGVRAVPFLYGVSGNGYLLQNNGRGEFTNITETVAPEMKSMGLITDAAWFDYDSDQDLDLVVVGEWMAITMFENQDGKLSNVTQKLGLADTRGFWNCIEVSDLNGDKKPDLVAGNQGLNTRFKASVEKPMHMYVNDFDNNGKIEQVVTMYWGENELPLAGRDELINQLPVLKSRYPSYTSYQGQSVQQIFGKGLVESAIKNEVNTTSSTCFIFNNGEFESKPLPSQAQLSPIYAILADDFNEDGVTDLFVGGNLYWSKPVVGIYDGSRGSVLIGTGNGNFQALDPKTSGVIIHGEIRDLQKVKSGNKQLVISTRINERPVVLETINH